MAASIEIHPYSMDEEERNHYYDTVEPNPIFNTSWKKSGGSYSSDGQSSASSSSSSSNARRKSEDDIVGPWDVFKKENIEVSNTDEDEFMLTVSKIAKVVAYIVTFVLVLGSSVVAKGTVVFMTSQMQPGRRTQFCNYPINYPDKHYDVHLDETEQSQWTWAIFFAFVFPEFFTLIRSARICIFKSPKRPKYETAAMVTLFETLHTIGVAALLIVAMPELDAVKGIMLTSCMGTVPAIMELLSRMPTESNRKLKLACDTAAIVAQVSGLLVWPLVLVNDQVHHARWAIPLGLLLTSFRWWENYASDKSQNKLVQYLCSLQKDLAKSRYYIYLFLSAWKALVFFVCMVGFISVTSTGPNFLQFFLTTEDRTLNVTAFNYTVLPMQPVNLNMLAGISTTTLAPPPTPDDTAPIRVTPSAALVTLAIQVLAAGMCYIVAQFTCRICIQTVSYTLPISLATPISVCLLISACGLKNDDVCFLRSVIPRYLYWTCPSNDYFDTFMAKEYGWIWFVWLLSHTWITLHLWYEKDDRLASAEKIFVAPLYTGVFIDQSLALNRRRPKEDEENMENTKGSAEEDLTITDDQYESIHVEDILGTPVSLPAPRPTDTIPKIIACATMWHETDEEMLQMLKSIMKMDEDQSARNNAQKYFQIVDSDYYTFEAHIFFDDAFDKVFNKEAQKHIVVVNRFVESLIRQVQEAAKKVHDQRAKIKKPSVVLTPYGGRLVWILPGGNKLTAHLKDKDHIRHRKRWSQVMYMYYFLGHKIMDAGMDILRKDAISENTFLLALDGDIDFTPKAVLLLVHLMKKDLNVGAACGRIHPTGSGMMVWYQKFEYAIGHWMQKATEHVIGCVLCSPGCFSLFRAKALMANNVLKTYTMKATEARHYVQYDQGEDRWLCTLILQQGYRVEYSAAADAYTQCPEGFEEFYNQRRRWIPSTLANNLDLLESAKHTVDANDNISTLYIAYQSMLMVGTILGPGTIFLMLVGAFNSAFKIDNLTAFEFNIVPIVLYIIVCFLAKADYQILFAQILTAFYAMVMMAVIVGVIIQMIQEDITSPSSFFTVSVAVSILVAALLHPTEFSCVIYGTIYWLVIPSMYLLLMIYSLMNLNNVSWGTREVAKPSTEQNVADNNSKVTTKQPTTTSRDNSFLAFLNTPGNGDSEGCINIELPGLCSFMCCTHPKLSKEEFHLMQIQEKLDGIVKRLDIPERSAVGRGLPRKRSVVRLLLPTVKEEESNGAQEGTEEAAEDDEAFQRQVSEEEPPQEESPVDSPMHRTDWIDNLGSSIGYRDSIPQQEIKFFEGLIEKYLYPLDKDEEKMKIIKGKLLDLRNLVVFAYLMLNGLFILFLFVLQINKDQIYMNWPIGMQTHIKYEVIRDDDKGTVSQVDINLQYKKLEPVGFMFVVFFALVIFIQFVGMLLHRFETLTHILSTTQVTCKKKIQSNVLTSDEAVKAARQLQRLSGVEDDAADGGRNFTFGDAGGGGGGGGGGEGKGGRAAYRRRNTIFNLAHTGHKSKPKINTLSTAFRQRLMSLTPEAGPPDEISLSSKQRLSIRRGTLNALIQRRDSLMHSPCLSSASQHSGSVSRQSSSVGGPRNGSGIVNIAYEESDTDDDISSLP